jgi:hypothetical protein
MAAALKLPATLGSLSDYSAEMASLFSKTEELTRSSQRVIEQTNAILLDCSLMLFVLRSQGEIRER